MALPQWAHRRTSCSSWAALARRPLEPYRSLWKALQRASRTAKRAEGVGRVQSPSDGGLARPVNFLETKGVWGLFEGWQQGRVLGTDTGPIRP